MKRTVMAEYHFSRSVCPFTTYKGKHVRRVEIDHLIPRSLGGADDTRNLWPECYEQVETDKIQQADGAHKKDRLEIELNKRLCRVGNPTEEKLESFRSNIKRDWIAYYQEIFGGN
jgi:hypothetical protein